jgi:hypothetical protein
LRITILACKTPPANPNTIQLLPPDNTGTGWYRRGTFPHCDRNGAIECDSSDVYCLDLASPDEGKYSRPLGNEMEAATSDPMARNPGNYGVVYNLRITVHNRASSGVQVHCLLNAAGGCGYSGITLDGVFTENASLLNAYASWCFKTPQIPAAGTSTFHIRFSLPGGSSGAHRLFFWPADS